MVSLQWPLSSAEAAQTEAEVVAEKRLLLPDKHYFRVSPD